MSPIALMPITAEQCTLSDKTLRDMADDESRLPVTILSGFLGALRSLAGRRKIPIELA
jgi:hypothetical protein